MDIAARDTLVKNHLKLVPPIAQRVKKSLPPSFELDDLISEGNIGLIRAAMRYDPGRHDGTPFSAFARPRIHGAMVDSVRRKAWLENTANPLDDAPEGFETPETLHAIDPSRTKLAIVGRSRPGSDIKIGRPVGRSARAFRSTRTALPQRVAAAIRRLPERQRVILGALYTDDYTLEQAAIIVGLTAAETFRQHTLALDFLRAELIQNLSISGSTLVFLSERAA